MKLEPGDVAVVASSVAAIGTLTTAYLIHRQNRWSRRRLEPALRIEAVEAEKRNLHILTLVAVVSNLDTAPLWIERIEVRRPSWIRFRNRKADGYGDRLAEFHGPPTRDYRPTAWNKASLGIRIEPGATEILHLDMERQRVVGRDRWLMLALTLRSASSAVRRRPYRACCRVPMQARPRRPIFSRFRRRTR